MRLTCANNYADLRRSSLEVERFLADHGVSPATRHAASLVIEEAASNVIRHGWNDERAHAFDLEVEVAEGYVSLVIEDDGPPFDPTTAAAPALGSTLAERRPGGMGLHLMRRTADRLAYHRAAGRNHLEIGLRINPSV